MDAAAVAAHRRPADVGLVAVSKQYPPTAIRAAWTAGQLDFGENYPQEALPKIDALADLPLRWHFIGRLQANKTALVANRFDWVHSLDRARIAQRLDAQRPHYAPPLQVCLQVKLGSEPAKGGVTADELPALATAVAALPRLKLRGLMGIPPRVDDLPATLLSARRWYEELAQRFASLRARGFDLDTLSMGMSGDFATAIACGATWVRVGTAIFGPRSVG